MLEMYVYADLYLVSKSLCNQTALFDNYLNKGHLCHLCDISDFHGGENG
jgi:hypothetical protein